MKGEADIRLVRTPDAKLRFSGEGLIFKNYDIIITCSIGGNF